MILLLVTLSPLGGLLLASVLLVLCGLAAIVLWIVPSASWVIPCPHIILICLLSPLGWVLELVPLLRRCRSVELLLF